MLPSALPSDCRPRASSPRARSDHTCAHILLLMCLASSWLARTVSEQTRSNTDIEVSFSFRSGAHPPPRSVPE
eukprot:2922924-Prymnesium_polylepis.1